MKLPDVLKTLQVEDTYLAAIEPEWDKSEASFPAAIPKFLTPAGYRKKFECTGLDPALLPVLDDISAKIVHNPALLHPRDTSVRRAMLDELQSGGSLRSGGMFFLAEDIERFGQKPYRNVFKVEGLKSLAV